MYEKSHAQKPSTFEAKQIASLLSATGLHWSKLARFRIIPDKNAVPGEFTKYIVCKNKSFGTNQDM